MQLDLSCPKKEDEPRGVGKPAQVLGAKDELKCGSGVMSRGQMRILTGAGLGHESL